MNIKLIFEIFSHLLLNYFLDLKNHYLPLILCAFNIHGKIVVTF